MSAHETLSFDDFWKWLVNHPNCIMRAGTPDSVLYDDEDLHWHFETEGPESFAVQVVRGKRLLGEILIQSGPITYVQGMIGEKEGEFVFELVVEAERVAPYFFVLTHAYEAEEQGPARVH